jgi:lambda family phage portal protein
MAQRRLRGWQPPLENINSLVASGGSRLLARARELVVTNGYAANSCEAFAANLVGDGIKPSSLIEDAEVRDRVQRLWLAWTDAADADGLTDFYGLQAMIAREMFVAGECFVRLRSRRPEDGLPVPLHLQLLQSEMLPLDKTATPADGRPIRCGIEFDRIGRRVAYHFRRRHPGDATDRSDPLPETVRVPADEVLHIYRPIDAGQIRGLPHVAPAMVRLFLLDQYDDAELERKKTAAMFAGFITKTAPEEALLGEIEAADDGSATASLEPGTMQVLLPGEDVKFSSPADVGGGYEAFQYRTLLGVSASLGLPYHLVTGDVRQANYSSLRAELVEFRRRIEQLQHGVMAYQLCRPVWSRWLDAAVLAGALELPQYARAPGRYRAVQWIPPRWDWVDPLKDIQAQVLAIEAGLVSRRKAVEATGYDIEEIDRENATDAARAAALGLTYRTSPGETQGSRATPATRPTPEE